MKSQIARLELLEESRRADPLFVLCEDSNGDTAKMTVREMLNTGRGFVHVVGGSSLSDLDKLLSAYHERAIQAVRGGEME